jgi:hypothetical protein
MEKQFVDGIFVKRSEKAPEFVIANLSFNVEKFTNFLKAQENERGWVNIDLKTSRKGTMYAELNTWKPPVKEQTPEKADDIPIINETPF